MLWRHNDYIGRVEAVGVREGELWVESEFSPHLALAQDIQREVQDGRLKGVSLGAQILEAELYEDDDGEYMLDIGKWGVRGGLNHAHAGKRQVWVSRQRGLKLLAGLKAEMALMAAEEIQESEEIEIESEGGFGGKYGT